MGNGYPIQDILGFLPVAFECNEDGNLVQEGFGSGHLFIFYNFSAFFDNADKFLYYPFSPSTLRKHKNRRNFKVLMKLIFPGRSSYLAVFTQKISEISPTDSTNYITYIFLIEGLKWAKKFNVQVQDSKTRRIQQGNL